MARFTEVTSKSEVQGWQDEGSEDRGWPFSMSSDAGVQLVTNKTPSRPNPFIGRNVQSRHLLHFLSLDPFRRHLISPWFSATRKKKNNLSIAAGLNYSGRQMLSAVFTPALWVIINKRCFLSSHLLYLLLILSSCSAFSFSLAYAEIKK